MRRICTLSVAACLLVVSLSGAGGKAQAVVQTTLKGHKGDVLSIAISHDGGVLVSGGQDKTVRLWDLNKGTEIVCLKGSDSPVYAVALSNDGNWLAAGRDKGKIVLWDLKAQKLVHTLVGHESVVSRLAFHPEGKLLASSSGDITGRVWHIMSGKEVHHWDDVPTTLAMSPDGKILAFGYGPHPIEFFEFATKKRLWKTAEQMEAIKGMVWTPDSKTLIVPQSRKKVAQVMLWDVAKKNVRAELKGFVRNVPAVAVSRDGKYLVVADNGNLGKRLKLYTLDPLAEVGTVYENQDSEIWRMCFGKENNILAVSDRDEIKILKLSVPAK